MTCTCDTSDAMAQDCPLHGVAVAHSCPPLSPELRRRIEAEIIERQEQIIGAPSTATFNAAMIQGLRWLLREADSLASPKGEK